MSSQGRREQGNDDGPGSMTESEFNTLRNELVAMREEFSRAFEQVDRRFEHVDQRFDAMDQRLREVETEVRVSRAEMKAKPDTLAIITINGLLFAILAFSLFLTTNFLQ